MCKAPTETPKQRYVKAGFPPYFAEDFLSSHWQVTQRCNFHCPYCVNKELRTAGIHMPPEIMHAALLHIAGTPRRRYRFSLSGGETTLWPHLEEMLDAIRTLYPPRTAVNMLTNGSASASRMRALLKDLFHYTGMRCAAGHSSIYIDELGRVSRGQFCGRMPYTVLERNPFEDPTFNGCVCTESFCTCIPFTALPKWRDAVNAPAWAHNEVPA